MQSDFFLNLTPFLNSIGGGGGCPSLGALAQRWGGGGRALPKRYKFKPLPVTITNDTNLAPM